MNYHDITNYILKMLVSNNNITINISSMYSNMKDYDLFSHSSTGPLTNSSTGTTFNIVNKYIQFIC